MFTTATRRKWFSTTMRMSSDKVLTIDKVNRNIRDTQYAVRGELAIRADTLKQMLEEDPKSAQFSSITNCNIGNPQQLGQKPISFFRQVLSLVTNPDLLDPKSLPITKKLYPSDAIERANQLLKSVGGSTGAYSHSQGILDIRRKVTQFIEQRDGFPANPEHIFLTAGASPGVQLVINTLIEHDRVGIMIPIPQYPLYTASIALFGGKAVPYYLNESDDWGLSVEELERVLVKARNAAQDVRALCVINPGNPTGQCLSEDNIRQIIEFAHKEGLVILADEVYQTNIYQPERRPFISFKKVLKSMGDRYSEVELISFHSVSKGMVGECGRRGGYFECTGIDKQVLQSFYKIVSISLCPPVDGQIMVDLMVDPPKEGDESYPLYEKEMSGIYESLKRRAIKLAEAFNSLEGVQCNPAQGAMYLFPTIKLPQKAIEEAESKNKMPDDFYCMELLNATGVCMVPGSGFGQEPGTWHFRCTFLPPEDKIDTFIDNFRNFHEEFLRKYV